jgi:transposase-like protein
LKSENKDEIMVTENVSNNAGACREKPKKWEFQKINGRNNIINNTTILTSKFTDNFVISNPSIYDK